MNELINKRSIELINYGSSLCETNPWLSQKIIAKGIKINPHKGSAYFNLGIALHLQKRPEAAIRAYQKSLLLKDCPYKSIKNNLAQDLLLSGNFKDGWKEYEMRLSINEYQFFQYHFGEVWEGIKKEESLPEEIILVCEQGFGDTIQFYRFAILLEQIGIKVILFCQKPLISLLKEGGSIKNVTDELSEQKILRKAKWCPLMSLPIKLGIIQDNIPYQKAYIKANKEKALEWRTKLQKKDNHKLIGLHWQGNHEFETKIYSKGRSMHFNNLLHLKNLENTEFVSLQKGDAQSQLITNEKLCFVKGQTSLNKNCDFTDTAAVIALCDLVITTDSVIAHLAGAMGVETWLALSWIPEWRWGLEGEKTNWYPNMRIFRQASQGDWGSVIQRINNALVS